MKLKFTRNPCAVECPLTELPPYKLLQRERVLCSGSYHYDHPGRPPQYVHLHIINNPILRDADISLQH